MPKTPTRFILHLTDGTAVLWKDDAPNEEVSFRRLYKHLQNPRAVLTAEWGPHGPQDKPYPLLVPSESVVFAVMDQQEEEA